ncbi:MAG: histidine kinase [Bacteroidota bacterium]
MIACQIIHFFRWNQKLSFGCLLCCCCCLTFGVAGQARKFQHLSVDDGLPSSTLYGMHQDQQGFIWIGSDNGVVRFDGTHFELYNKEEGLADTEVLGMGADHLGRIWFWTYNKQACYYFQGRIYGSHNHPKLKQLLRRKPPDSEAVVQYKQGKDGQLYVLSGNAYLRFDQSNTLQALPNPTNSDSKLSWRLVKVEADGQLWVINDEVLATFDPVHKQLDTIKQFVQQSPIIFQEHIFRIHRGVLQKLGADQDWQDLQFLDFVKDKSRKYQVFVTRQHYWISDHQNGIYSIDRTNPNAPLEKWLEDYRISFVIEDHEGNYWFSTLGDGLFLYRPNAFPLLNTEDGLNSNKVHSVLIHPDDRSIFAGHNNGSISRWSPNKAIVHYHFSQRSGYNRIHDMHLHTDRFFYIGDREVKSLDQHMRNPIDYMQNNAALALGGIKSIFFDSSYLYIGSSAQLNRLALDQQFGVERVWEQAVLCGYAVHQEKLYFGGNTGLFQWENGTVTRLLKNHPAFESRVNHLTGNDRGWLFVSSQERGLLVLKDDQVIEVNTQNGLSNNNCLVALSQNDSTLWVGTSCGLNKIIFDASTARPQHISNYYDAHGLGSNLIHDLYLQDSLLAVGTDNGLNLIHPYNALPDHDPLMVIMSLTKKDSVYFGKKQIALPYDYGDLQINFTGISFSKKDKLTFQYRLLGLDSTWTNTSSRVVHYAGLLPGQYLFELSSPNSSSGEGKQRLAIKITPRYWQRTSFKLAGLLAILLICLLASYLMMQWTKKKDLKRARLKQQIAQLELQALQAQLNPHFMANTLNSIQHFILEKEVRLANEHLTQFAALMRMYLEHSSFQFTSLTREMELLNAYLQLEKLSHEHRFDYQITYDDDLKLSEWSIPTMILQPLVENAIIHGLLPAKAKGRLWIGFELKGRKIICTIQDNGIGRAASRALQFNKRKKLVSRGNQILQEKVNALERLGEQHAEIQYTDLFTPQGESIGTKVEVIFTAAKLVEKANDESLK